MYTDVCIHYVWVLEKIHIVLGKMLINNMHFLKATKHDHCDISNEPLLLYRIYANY